jgi:hypothetical protein
MSISEIDQTSLDFLEADGLLPEQSKHDQRISSIVKNWLQEEDKRPLHIRDIPPIEMKEYRMTIGDNEQKISNTIHNQGIIPPTGFDAKLGIDISWGGDKGTEASGYVSGSASDDKGNEAELKVEVNSDGSGSANISASHHED